jgi:hypothetical protein
VINHIDLSLVLRRTVCDLYSDLVTRSTGAAVRSGIEQQLAELEERTLTVIDFTRVGLLDFSCADEIVAKLLLRYGGETAPRDAFFVFRGLGEAHVDAIEAVLARHDLALVAESADGAWELLGTVTGDERRVWDAVTRLGRATPQEVAREAGLSEDEARSVLGALGRRRLLMRFEDVYLAVGAAA